MTARDVPSKANIIKSFPELRGAAFASDATRKVGIPASRCGTNTVQTVRSARSIAGVGTSGKVTVISGVVEFKTLAQAKSAFKKYKAYVTRCQTFTVSGVRVRLTRDAAPRIGQERLAMTVVSTVAGTRGYASSVIIRHGKRMATVAASDNGRIAKARLNGLAKVAAIKMR